MRKLKIIEHMSLDGVVQNSEDDGDGFPYIDWTVQYRTPEGRDRVLEAHGERLDLLLGRFTYDMFSGYWPNVPDNPMADRLNAATKYVATHHPDTLGAWGPVEPVGPDLVEGVRRIKSLDGPGLVVIGSSTLTSALLEHGLADEVLLLIYPVFVGVGKRLFADGTPAQTLELTGTETLPSGIVITSYEAAGPLKS
jgi:dihydrofolate reductase